nr:MAG TPA: hypothetical protein [Caudoviricetes sp.]
MTRRLPAGGFLFACWLHAIAHGCTQLHAIAYDCTRLPTVARDCTQLHTVARCGWDITRVSIRSAARAVCGSDVRGSTDEWPGSLLAVRGPGLSIERQRNEVGPWSHARLSSVPPTGTTL